MNSKLRKAKKWTTERLLLLMIMLMTFLLIAIFFAPKVFIIIYPGEAGVLFRRLGKGTVTEKYYQEGLNIIPPWDIMYIYDIRLQEESGRFSVLTKDGLTVQTTVSIRFSPNIKTLGVMHKYIGPNYVQKVILPEVKAETKNVISSYDLEGLYTTDREQIQYELSDSILRGLNKQILLDSLLKDGDKEEEYIIFEDLFITDIQLPMQVEETIEKKIIAEQEYLTYDYILKREEKEAVRKQIEAAGIDSFQTTANISILKWRGLEATEKLARSPNTKLVILGTDENLPVILNGEVSNSESNQ